MGKGRKPISNALKVLKGTDQPCRMREEISYEKITKIPKAPDYMCIAMVIKTNHYGFGRK